MMACTNCRQRSARKAEFTLGSLIAENCSECGKLVRASRGVMISTSLRDLIEANQSRDASPSSESKMIPCIYMIVRDGEVMPELRRELDLVSGLSFELFDSVRAAMTKITADIALGRRRKLLVFDGHSGEGRTAFLYGVRAAEMAFKSIQMPILALAHEQSSDMERCISEVKNARFVSMMGVERPKDFVKRYLQILDKLSKR